MRLLLALLLLLSTFAPAADESFRRALTAYKAGEYQIALTEFKKIAEDGKQISAALCHNIANCEYKLGQAADGDTKDQIKEAHTHYGQASTWYRRALALDPWLPEARQNQRFLHDKLGFHRFEPDSVPEKIAAFFPRAWWRTGCLIAVWVAVIATVWLAWATPRPGRRWPLVTILCIAVVEAILGGLGLWVRSSDPAPLSKRLVNTIAPEAYARTAPAEAASPVITLKPGSELLPVKEEGYWTYVEIPGGDEDRPTRGWVRTNTTEKLWPWPASLVE